MDNYETVTQAINDLTNKGYDYNFSVQDDGLFNLTKNIHLKPSEFQIDEVHRFEGITNPDDESVVYAISSPTLNIKGILVNAYGVYAETASAELVEKLKIKH